MTDRQWNIICRFMYVVLYTMVARSICGGVGAAELLAELKVESKLTVENR
jgi:hypothetical protein